MYVLAMLSAFPSIQSGFLNQPFPLHGHHLWEIHLFTGGKGRLVQDGLAWAVGPGSLTLSPPGRRHELVVDGVLTFFYLQFEGERELAGVLGRLVAIQTRQGPLRVDPATVAEVGRLKDKLGSKEPDRVASGFHGFRALLYDLAVGGAAPLADEIDRTLAWLRQNLDRPLGLQDLVPVAGLGPFDLCRRFKARTGLSPLAYIHRSKVEAAGFLLSSSDLSLAEVAARFGFSDEFHFGKVFKKVRGVPPGRWRRTESAAR